MIFSEISRQGCINLFIFGAERIQKRPHGGGRLPAARMDRLLKAGIG